MEKLQHIVKIVKKCQHASKVKKIYYKGKPQYIAKISRYSIKEKALASMLLLHQFLSIYKTGKKIFTYKKYAHNLGQSDSDLFADHIHAKIMIVAAIDINLFRYYYDAVVHPAGHSSK